MALWNNTQGTFRTRWTSFVRPNSKYELIRWNQFQSGYVLGVFIWTRGAFTTLRIRPKVRQFWQRIDDSNISHAQVHERGVPVKPVYQKNSSQHKEFHQRGQNLEATWPTPGAWKFLSFPSCFLFHQSFVFTPLWLIMTHDHVFRMLVSMFVERGMLWTKMVIRGKGLFTWTQRKVKGNV